MKKMKRFMSFSLCFVLLLSMVLQNHSEVSAANTETNNDVTVEKSVAWNDFNERIAKVTVKVTAKDHTYDQVIARPTSIVLVLDASNSMNSNSKLDNAKTAAQSFVSTLLGKEGSGDAIEIAVVSFNTNANTIIGFSNDKEKINKGIDSIKTSQGTNIQGGIRRAEELLKGKSGNKIMVLLSDGEPSCSYKITKAEFTPNYDGLTNCNKKHKYPDKNAFDYTVKECSNDFIGLGESLKPFSNSVEVHCECKAKSKDVTYSLPANHGVATIFEGQKAKELGITTYSIGYGVKPNSEAQKIMNSIASNGQSYNSSLDEGQIDAIFESISKSVEQSIAAGINAKLTSKSNDFYITNKSNVDIDLDYTVVGDSISTDYGAATTTDGGKGVLWDVKTLPNKTITLTYLIKITSDLKDFPDVNDIKVRKSTLNYNANDENGKPAQTTTSINSDIDELQYYTVTFYIDGINVGSDVVESGGKATEPNYPYDSSRNYTEWDEDFTNVSENLDVHKTSVQTYQVTFFIDGVQVEDPQRVVAGQDATEPTVTKDPTRDYSEWDTNFTNVSENLNVHMTSVQTYNVTFFVDGVQVEDPQRVVAGQDATEPTVTKDPTRDYSEWDKDFTNVSENLDVNMTSVQTYQVRFFIDSEQVGDTQRIVDGQSAKEPNYSYDVARNYSNWDQDFSKVTKNLDVKKTSTIKTFTVTFVNEDGTTVLDTDVVNYGKDATYEGSTPSKAADGIYSYEFSGWDKPYTNVTSNLVVKATYAATVIVAQPTTPAGQPVQTESPASNPSQEVPEETTPAGSKTVPEEKTPASGDDLPNTGTVSFDVFYVAGALLVLFGASILVIKKGKRA